MGIPQLTARRAVASSLALGEERGPAIAFDWFLAGPRPALWPDYVARRQSRVLNAEFPEIAPPPDRVVLFANRRCRGCCALRHIGDWLREPVGIRRWPRRSSRFAEGCWR